MGELWPIYPTGRFPVREAPMFDIIALAALPRRCKAADVRRLAGWVCAAGLGLLTACAGLPPHIAARTSKPAQAYATAHALAAPIADWPADGWWKAYGDPQLNSLMDEALAGSPDMAQAEARVRKSRSATQEARAASAPQLTFDGAVEEQKQSYNNGIPPAFVPHGYNDTVRTALDFNWELDFWGRNRAAVAAAVSQAKAASAEAAQTRLMLTTSVAAAYAELGRLYAQRDIAVRALALREETLKLTRLRVVNGLDNRQTLAQGQAGPPASRGDLDALDEAIAQTRNRLAALLGAGPDRGLSIARPPALGPKPFGLPPRLAADLIGRRPDVVAARWRAEAAEHRIGQARAAFYPDVNLVAFIGAEALHVNTLTVRGSDVGGVGPALSLPIFEGGRLRADLHGAQADRDAAVAAYDAALTEALHQVADATVGERAISSRLPDARAALAADENAWRIARLRYDGGLSSYPSVLQAEQTVLNQRRVVVDLESRALTLDVALVRALGGGFTTH